MSLWRQLTRGLRTLLDREGADQDVADEVAHYVDESVASLVAAGVPLEEARRRVAREVGATSVLREEVRSYGWENAVEDFLEDLRIGVRKLRRSPGFTVATVGTLALGIGAATAIFSAVRPVLLDPLPYPASGQLVDIADRGPDGSRVDVAFGSHVEIARRSMVLDEVAVMRGWQPTVTGAGEPERLIGQRVSAAYFRVLGVGPAFGPSFDVSADRPGGSRVVILADGLWRRRFGADSGIIGRQVELDGVGYTVVAVMPAVFENVTAPAASVWSLLQYDEGLPSLEGREWGHHLRMVGRLRQGSTAAQAERELERLAANPIPELTRPRWASLEWGLSVTPLRDTVTRAARPVLLAIAASVVLVLLIACVNAANLLIARGVQRRGEFAMRAALGAGHERLIRQVLTESLLLTALAAGLGLAVAALGVRALVALSPPELPRLQAIGLDGRALVLSLSLAALVGIAVGLAPAVRAARAAPRADVRDASRRSSRGPRRTQRALVAAQVALTLVLLVSAGLLLRSLNVLFRIDPGFEPQRVLAVQVQTSGPRFADGAATHRFFDLAVEAVGHVPGVTAAAMTSQLPLTGEADQYGVQPEHAVREADRDLAALRYVVSPAYFETLGIPLRSGRLLSAPDEDADGARSVVISESLAGDLFPGRDAVGQRLHYGRPDLPWYTVVGVVGDVKQVSLAAGDAPAVYLTPAQWYFADGARWIVVRTRARPEALVGAIKAAIWSVDGDQPIVRVATMDDLAAASAAERRLAFRVFQAFALAALLLAAIGLYGVLSGSVVERVREFGIRLALGSTRHGLVGLVMRDGLVLTGIGVAIGAVAAAALTRMLTTLLYGVSPLDLVTYAGVIVILGSVAALASALPAWRASRIPPSVALRCE